MYSTKEEEEKEEEVEEEKEKEEEEEEIVVPGVGLFVVVISSSERGGRVRHIYTHRCSLKRVWVISNRKRAASFRSRGSTPSVRPLVVRPSSVGRPSVVRHRRRPSTDLASCARVDDRE